MEGAKIIGYNAFSAGGVDTTALIEAGSTDTGSESKTMANMNDVTTAVSTTAKKKDCSRSDYMQAGMLLTNTLLTFIFAIVIIVLTAAGKPNIRIRVYDLDKGCDCTSFTPSLSYGLAVSLFIEIGLMVTLLILAVVLMVVGEKYSKLVEYYGYVAGSLVGLNFLAFLCMTLAVIVFVAMGTSTCCSATSIAVASLSAFLMVIKTLFICCFCCIMLTDD